MILLASHYHIILYQACSYLHEQDTILIHKLEVLTQLLKLLHSFVALRILPLLFVATFLEAYINGLTRNLTVCTRQIVLLTFQIFFNICKDAIFLFFLQLWI